MTTPLRGLYVMRDDVFSDVYGPEERQAIERYVTIGPGPMDEAALRAHPGYLADIDVLLSSWGCPQLDAELLSHAPRLRAVFYAAGSVRKVVTPAVWERDIAVVSAKQGIAERVAEFAASIIFLSLKHFWRYAHEIRAERAWVRRWPVPGTVASTVGLVSLGSVGHLVARRLAGSELKVVAYDPYASRELAERADCALVALEELFEMSDVVSLHAPLLPETAGMIDAGLLASMKEGATIINTSRGGVLNHEALVAVLVSRPDLTAVLDVTDPEPPPPGSPLYSLPNVVMTPHIAGNLSRERRALGRGIAGEVERFARGEALRWAVQPSSLAHSA
jgi:phosphoglycerate dehydrogenase-like enzyme